MCFTYVYNSYSLLFLFYRNNTQTQLTFLHYTLRQNMIGKVKRKEGKYIYNEDSEEVDTISWWEIWSDRFLWVNRITESRDSGMMGRILKWEEVGWTKRYNMRYGMWAHVNHKMVVTIKAQNQNSEKQFLDNKVLKIIKQLVIICIIENSNL